MSEKIAIFLAFFFMILFSFASIFFMKFYWVEFDFEGNIVGKDLIGEEKITYHLVFGEFHKVYRYFSRGEIEILDIKCSDGKEYVYKNWVSCNGPFKSKDITLEIKYRIKNAFEVYKDVGILFHSLFDEYGSFVKVNYKIKLPTDIIKVYKHPPIISSSFEGNTLKASAFLFPMERFELRIITEKDGLKETNNIYAMKEIEKVEPFSYYILYYLSFPIKAISLALFILSVIFVYLTPFFFLYYWYKYGREIEVLGVPDFYRMPPTKRKAWEVNLLLNDGELTRDALYATILELKRMGYIDLIEKEERGFFGKKKRYLIKILKDPDDKLDDFQRNVLKFLIDFSERGIFDPKNLKSYSPSYVEDKFSSIFSGEHKQSKKKEFFYTEGEDKIGYLAGGNLLIFIVGILSVLFKFFSFITESVLFEIGGPVIVLSVINVVFLLGLSSYFTKTRREFIRERRLWEAFERFLSDITLIKRYPPESLDIWEEYLIYATALGVAKSVIDAMKELNVLEEFERSTGISTGFVLFYPSQFSNAYSSAVSRGSSSSFGGGLGGIGGGVGGGGGGAD